jgi:hypothetical protein
MRALIPLVLICGCAFAVSADDDVGATRNAFVATQDPLGESVTKVVYLEQNWTPGESTRFSSHGPRQLPVSLGYSAA